MAISPEPIGTLQGALAPWLRKGFVVQAQFPSQVQLFRRKRIDPFFALAWLLMCGVGIVVYLVYYLMKSDESVMLTLEPDGRVTSRTDVSLVNRAGAIAGALAWAIGTLVILGIATGIGGAWFGGEANVGQATDPDAGQAQPEGDPAEPPEEARGNVVTDVLPGTPLPANPPSRSIMPAQRREIDEVCSEAPDRAACVRQAERAGLCPDARTPEERRQCIEVTKLLAAQGMPLASGGSEPSPASTSDGQTAAADGDVWQRAVSMDSIDTQRDFCQAVTGDYTPGADEFENRRLEQEAAATKQRMLANWYRAPLRHDTRRTDFDVQPYDFARHVFVVRFEKLTAGHWTLSTLDDCEVYLARPNAPPEVQQGTYEDVVGYFALGAGRGFAEALVEIPMPDDGAAEQWRRDVEPNLRAEIVFQPGGQFRVGSTGLAFEGIWAARWVIRLLDGAGNEVRSIERMQRSE
jgi:hypothetical protein